jgi:hypothetical protein
MRWFRRRRKAFIVTKKDDKASTEFEQLKEAEAEEPESETPKPAAVYDPDKE